MRLLEIDLPSIDPMHQFLINDEPALSVYNDGTLKPGGNKNICLAFTVDDIDKAHALVQSMGAVILTPPTLQPWSACNMSFLDPDDNTVYLRQLPTKEQE